MEVFVQLIEHVGDWMREGKDYLRLNETFDSGRSVVAAREDINGRSKSRISEDR